MKSSLFLAALACAALGSAQAASLNTNLVTNGDAETEDLTGWVHNGIQTTTATVYAGRYAFTAALGANPEVMTQRIDLTDFAALIDAGEASFSLSAQLQDRTFDFVTMSLSFFDENVMQVGATYSDNDPTNSPFVWDYLSEIEDSIGLGARTAVLSFEFTRSTGISSDAYVDDIDFRITSDAAAVPLPAALPLFAAGFLGLRLRSKRS